MPLTIWNCVLSYRQNNNFRENVLFFQEISFITKFEGSNCLLPPIYTGSKWDFQVANLLLATVNFEPWDQIVSFKRRSHFGKASICR